jgi:predicted dehydrogenase
MTNPSIAVIGLNHGWKFVGSLYFHSDFVGGKLAAICGVDGRPDNAPKEVPFYDDYIKLLNEIKPDGIVAAVPNHIHLEITREAAKRGIAVMLEKPIAGTLNDARQIIDIVNETKIPFQIGHHRRSSLLMIEARNIIQSGRLGKMIGASVMWMSRKPDSYFQAKWRVTEGVGGPLLINSIHDIDDLRFTMGEIDRVHAFVGQPIRGNDVEDTGVANILFKNGAMASYIFSDGTPSKHFYEACAQEDPFFHPASEDCYWFFGEKGTLAFPTMRITGYDEKSGGEDWTRPFSSLTVPVERFNPINGEMKNYCDMIKDPSVETRCSAEDATQTLKVIEAIRFSAKTGQTIILDQFNG